MVAVVVLVEEVVVVPAFVVGDGGVVLHKV